MTYITQPHINPWDNFVLLYPTGFISDALSHVSSRDKINVAATFRSPQKVGAYNYTPTGSC
jgi:hypothetical protein